MAGAGTGNAHSGSPGASGPAWLRFTLAQERTNSPCPHRSMWTHKLKRPRFLWIAILVFLAVGLLAARFVRAREQNRVCLNNLRLVDGVIINVAVEQRYQGGQYIPFSILTNYLPAS